MLEFLILSAILHLTPCLKLDPSIDKNNESIQVSAINHYNIIDVYGRRANNVQNPDDTKDFGINIIKQEYSNMRKAKSHTESNVTELKVENESATDKPLLDTEISKSREITGILNISEVNQNMIRDSSDGDMKTQMRNKRAINNGTIVNITVLNNDNETVTNGNDINDHDGRLSNGNDTAVNETLSGRRTMMNITPFNSASEMRTKLLAYLDDTFQEIERKVQPLDNVKILLTDNNNYKLGYITANIDTLATNLQKVRADMYTNKDHWSDSKILELFDKLKNSNRILSNLLESLALSLPKHYSGYLT